MFCSKLIRNGHLNKVAVYYSLSSLLCLTAFQISTTVNKNRTGKFSQCCGVVFHIFIIQ